MGKGDGCASVDQGKRDLRVAFVAKHRLTHQQFVKIRVDEGPNNRVDLPAVVPDAGRDIGHGGLRYLPNR